MSGYRLSSAIFCAVIGFTLICAVSCTSGRTVLPSAPEAISETELQQALAAEFERLGINPNHVTASAPQGIQNEVLDLSCQWQDESVGYQVEITWTEALQGDYNQDGIVELGDLTPLGQRFNRQVKYSEPESAFAPTWLPAGDPEDDGGIGENGPPILGSAAENWRTARVDGNSDGLISVSDLTTIAQHWQERLTGYLIYRSNPGESSFELLENPDNPDSAVTIYRPSVDANRPVRYRFVDTLIEPGIYSYYLVAFDAYSSTKGPSTDAVYSPIAFTKHITNLIGD